MNKPESYNKYTLCIWPSLTGTKYKDGNKILKDLMSDDLVELKKEPRSKSFRITQKGIEFMEDFRKIRHVDTIVSIEICIALREQTKVDWF